jgi:hypothetical protein
MSDALLSLPACKIFLIERALKRMGYSYESPRRCVAMEEGGRDDDGETAYGLALVVDGDRRGVASALYGGEERDAPRVRWASNDGDLLRIYQAEMRRVGADGSVHVCTLLGDMQ